MIPQRCMRPDYFHLAKMHAAVVEELWMDNDMNPSQRKLPLVPIGIGCDPFIFRGRLIPKTACAVGTNAGSHTTAMIADTFHRMQY